MGGNPIWVLLMEYGIWLCSCRPSSSGDGDGRHEGGAAEGGAVLLVVLPTNPSRGDGDRVRCGEREEAALWNCCLGLDPPVWSGGCCVFSGGVCLKDSANAVVNILEEIAKQGIKPLGLWRICNQSHPVRMTFGDCNRVRSLIESQCIQMIERGISMDSGFREELRVLMEKEVRVPVVFVKGKLMGEADEVLILEEGKLSFLLEGIP
ncbi:hypothetical protein CKAN_02407100 [Cinnamomum micranthum f. kanehirae]|uniref:Glutaredoxin domain-containing protein n=1 Tax=Cinnamomum micranthum f. kanehirae TaxID=337451 RepID=A0A3S3N915_9MAGN|nr:hypothetical protein CKAN_02407100 [Cinnamomum micranthum f. kanehirae]